MEKKWIFAGAAFALAMALNGCGDNAAASIPQQSSQEQNAQASGIQTAEADSPAAAPAQAQTSAPTTAQTVTGIGTVDEAAAQKIAQA